MSILRFQRDNIVGKATIPCAHDWKSALSMRHIAVLLDEDILGQAAVSQRQCSQISIGGESTSPIQLVHSETYLDTRSPQRQLV